MGSPSSKEDEQEAEAKKKMLHLHRFFLQAARTGRLNQLKLIQNRGNINFQDPETKLTVLMMAAHNGQTEVVRYLLEWGAAMDLADNHDWTSLIHAARNNHLRVVELLLESKANHTRTDENLCTALMAAADKGHLEVVLALAAVPPFRLDQTSKFEDSALTLAARNGHAHVVEFLLEAKADSDIPGYLGRTAVWQAATRGHAEVVRMLASHGADVSIKDAHGRTVLDCDRDGTICRALEQGSRDLAVARLERRGPLSPWSRQEVWPVADVPSETNAGLGLGLGLTADLALTRILQTEARQGFFGDSELLRSSQSLIEGTRDGHQSHREGQHLPSRKDHQEARDLPSISPPAKMQTPLTQSPLESSSSDVGVAHTQVMPDISRHLPDPAQLQTDISGNIHTVSEHTKAHSNTTIDIQSEKTIEEMGQQILPQSNPSSQVQVSPHIDPQTEAKTPTTAVTPFPFELQLRNLSLSESADTTTTIQGLMSPMSLTTPILPQDSINSFTPPNTWPPPDHRKDATETPTSPSSSCNLGDSRRMDSSSLPASPFSQSLSASASPSPPRHFSGLRSSPSSAPLEHTTARLPPDQTCTTRVEASIPPRLDTPRLSDDRMRHQEGLEHETKEHQHEGREGRKEGTEASEPDGDRSMAANLSKLAKTEHTLTRQDHRKRRRRQLKRAKLLLNERLPHQINPFLIRIPPSQIEAQVASSQSPLSHPSGSDVGGGSFLPQDPTPNQNQQQQVNYISV